MESKVRTISINLADIPKYFNMDYTSELCARDIIAYVRGSIEENPWVPVVLECNSKPISSGELEGSAIYWKGINDDKINNILGLSVYTYCVVNVSSLDRNKSDCGLGDILVEFKSKYGIHTFDILVVGENDGDAGESVQTLVKLKEYVYESGRDDVIFPAFIVRQNKRLEHGLDIDPYAKLIDSKRNANTLDASYLTEVLQELAEKISHDTTVIQDLDGRRTQTIKLLITYLNLKHNLPPIYLSSFVADYLRFQFFYPRTKLSLYERVAFMRRLPKAVGYISANQDFHCLAAVANKLYPKPHYIFDLEKRCLVEATQIFELQNPELKFIDYRRMFPHSQHPLCTSQTTRTDIAVSNSSSDEEVDRKLVDMFATLSTLVGAEPVFLSVKNTVMVDLRGKRYILYCPEEFGVQLHMISEYIGHYVTVITEGNFYRLIDAQLEKAILERDRAPSSTKASHALATVWRQWNPENALQPALPLDVSLYMCMLPQGKNGLSYYDQALRCSRDVLPIITSLDSELRDVSPLFKDISLKSLRNDPQSKYAINSFGTTTTYSSQVPVIPITYNVFNEGRLF